MAKLTAAARKKLPASTFAGPGKSFPIPDASHARAALSGAPRSLHAGNISKATEERVIAKAHAKLGKTASSGKKAKGKHKPRLGFVMMGDGQG